MKTARHSKTPPCLLWLAIVASSAQAQPAPANPSTTMQDHLRRLEQSSPATPKSETPTPRPIPPQAPATSATVLLAEIQYSPSTLLSAEELGQLSAPYIGRPLTTADIQTLLDNISKLYQQKGVLTAVPILPQQNLRSGTLRVLLVEGRLGRIKINSSLVDPEWMRHWFTLKEGEVVTQAELSRNLNLFNAGIDYTASAEFVAGEQFGVSDLSISIPDINPLQYWTFAEVNSNDSSHSNLLAFGVRLSPASNQGGRIEAAALRTSQGETLLASTSWPLGFKGWRAAGHASLTQTRNRIQAQDSSPDITIKGKASSIGLEALRVWPLDESATLKTHIAWGSTESSSSLGEEKLAERKQEKLSLGATFEHNTISTQSWLKLASVFAKEQGGSVRYTEVSAAALANLDPERHWSVKIGGYGRVSLTGKDLDVDPFAIGGQDSVRGYTAASIASQQGHAIQAELRFRPAIQESLPMDLMAFWDSGKAYSSEESKSISSAGIGLQARLTHQLSLELIYSRQLKLQEAQPNRWMARLSAYW